MVGGFLNGFLIPGMAFNDGLRESIRPIYLSVVESFLCLKTIWISIIVTLAFAKILAVKCLTVWAIILKWLENGFLN